MTPNTPWRVPLGALCVGAVLTGCASPLDERRPPAASWQDPWLDMQRPPPPRANGSPANPRDDAHRADTDPLPANATLEDVLTYAQTHSVALRAAQERWQAAAARIDSARFLPDPRVSYLHERDGRPRKQEIMVEQAFPWFGTIERRRDAATYAAEAELARVSEQWLAIRARIIENVLELGYLDARIALTRDTAELVTQLESSLRAQYMTQPDMYAAVVRAQVEVGRLENELESLVARRVPLAARLNAMLSRPADAPLPEAWASPDEVLDAHDDDVVAWLEDHNPTLRAQSALVESLRQGQAVARAENNPDFTLGAGADVTTDEYIFAVSMRVPIWRERNEGRVREATSNRLAAAHEREDARHRLRAEASDLLFQHHDAQRRIVLLRDTLIPKAEEAMRAVLACCAAGNTGLQDALDAERTLLSLRLEEARAVADRASTLAQLESLSGVPLPRRIDAYNDAQSTEGDEQ